MQEYWVNVYEGHPWVCSGRPISEQLLHDSLEDAQAWSKMVDCLSIRGKTIYRIHVKMNPPHISIRETGILDGYRS